MFLYLFFLRPPPSQSSTTQAISVTPQISNDLRTELFDGARDIYYSWSRHATHNSPLVLTRAVKLTTWRPANAYKELSIPAPPGVRNGESWRLILTTQPCSDLAAIDLQAADFGRDPFPVVSLPILFGPKTRQYSASKQEKIERLYQLHLPDPESGALKTTILKITEQTSFDLDKKIWDSGVGLGSWLLDFYRTPGNSAGAGLRTLWEALFAHKPRNVLELGAGTGIVSLVLSAIRSSSPRLSEGAADRIVVSDLDTAMPLLEHNISANSHLFTTSRPEASVLNWDDPLPDDIHTLQGQLDAIVMADVTYNTASFPSLVRTLASLLSLCRPPPVVLLGYKERDPAERSLWDLAREIGLEFSELDQKPGAGGEPVEIWFGQVANVSA